MRTLILFFTSIAAYAQVTVNAPSITIDSNANAAHVLTWMSGQTTNVSTKLTSGIDAVTTSVTVDSATGIAANSVIVIDTEHIGVASVAGNVLTVQRGYNGTTAATHAASATVKELKYRTVNLLAKALVIDGLRAIVRQGKQTAVSAAQSTVDSETTAAVQ
jgi:hypothetical protein